MLKQNSDIGQKCLVGLFVAGTGFLVSAQFAVAQTTAVVPTDQELLDTNRQRAPRQNIKTPVVEAGTQAAPDVDPFAPLGIQIGSLRLTSFFEQGIGYSTNVQSEALGKGGFFSKSELNLELRSQWQRHELLFNASGVYDAYFDDEPDNNATVNIDGRLRLDLIDGFSTTIGGNYGFANEAASSTSLTSDAINEPRVHAYGGFAELSRSGHRIDLTLRGSIDRSVYEDAKLANGGLFSQEDRDLTTYGLSTRIAYQTGLAFSPFVQLGYARAIHDLSVDRNGEQRDSDSYELRGGLLINISEKINGEISAGYAIEEFVDPGLAALAGLVFDANLNWSPQRDTNIALTMGTDLGGSTTAGDSGAFTYNAGLAVTRRIRDNLELNAGLGLSYTNFDGLGRIDTTYTAQLGFEYWLNRSLSITGETRFESLDSTLVGSSYDAAAFTLGIKVQR